MKKILITGATSMLGLALINECLKKQTKVVAVIREDSRKGGLIPDNPLITVVQSNLHNLKALTLGLDEGLDAFYHFAWFSTDNKSRNLVEDQNSNIQYTLDAVNLAARLGCKKFIGAGSQAEYGRVTGRISQDMRVFPDSAYGIAKYAAGRLSAILCKQLGMDFIWTRIFSTYGINDMPSTMIMYTIDSLLDKRKPMLTKCEQVWDYLNCRDAAKAFYLVGQKGHDQAVYNIGSGQAHSLSQFVYKIRDAIDPSLELGIGEKEYAPQQVMSLCADISNLVKDTGFQPEISFDEGIVETINWYKENMLK
ncbi:NAD-dependent epimerase/dehydratase family protein [Paenibacillus puldeungensis]|uniref:NAD-dependent epimerase/dehydratase family protein n=1 Tax=Paenibacillus puldeungensis TaxID=696536 RepID=A0ABW3S3U9_9BACL